MLHDNKPENIQHTSLPVVHRDRTVSGSGGTYVVAVPVLVSLTDRIPTRRIYVVGAGLTALAHLGFALIADGFWPGLILRAVAGSDTMLGGGLGFGHLAVVTLIGYMALRIRRKQ